jgi:RNA polymerase sigma factor (sigma-70 family)
MTYDDLVAVGLEAVWKVLESHPDATNSFINNKVAWSMQDAIRNWRTRQNVPRIERIDAPNAEQLFDPKTLPDGTAYKRQRLDTLKRAIPQLPKRTQEIVMRRLQGDLTDDIARDMGVSQARITQIMMAAIEVLRKIVEAEETPSVIPQDSDPDDS